MTENIELADASRLKPKTVDASRLKDSVKIDTIELLLIHLTKYAAAYRKNYKLCGRVDIALKITSGLIGCTAIPALIPAIPLVVTISGAIPAGITVISQKAQFAEKKALHKAQYRKIKELLSYTHKMSAQIPAEDTEGKEKQLIKEVFAKMKEHEKDANYITPMEMYLKEYKLNGYA